MHLYTDSFNYHCTIQQSNPELPYLLMLHGFMGSRHVFDHLLQDLSLFCNPVTIDLAGHGDTTSPTDPAFYHANRQVQQLRSVIQRLDFEDLYLYGYSMGGRLAFQLGANCLHLFRKVIVESTHCGLDSDTERTKRQKTDDHRAAQIEENFNDFLDHWNELPLFKFTPDIMKMRYRDIMITQNPETISASLRGFGAGLMPNVCNKASKSGLNFTCIVGEMDKKYLRIMSKISDTIPNSQLHIVKNAGHRVHTDQPKKLIQILRETIDS